MSIEAGALGSWHAPRGRLAARPRGARREALAAARFGAVGDWGGQWTTKRGAGSVSLESEVEGRSLMPLEIFGALMFSHSAMFQSLSLHSGGLGGRKRDHGISSSKKRMSMMMLSKISLGHDQGFPTFNQNGTAPTRTFPVTSSGLVSNLKSRPK